MPTIDYGNTNIIDVPQSELTLVSGTTYTHDVNQFHLDLRDLEDDDYAGIAFPRTHQHITEVVLSGVTYSRFVIILAPYTVRYEDTGSPYTVSLTGANNNIADRLVSTPQVTLVTNNAAGLITVTSGSGLDTEQDTIIREVHKYLGLNSADPVEHTPTRSKTDSLDIDITRSGNGESLSRLVRQ